MKVSYSQATVQYAGFIPVFACRRLQCKAFNWAGLGYKVFAIVFRTHFRSVGGEIFVKSFCFKKVACF
jgi:hypothetical protein